VWKREHVNVLPLFQNIIKNWLIKVDVFGVKFRLDILIFVDPFLLIIWNEENKHDAFLEDMICGIGQSLLASICVLLEVLNFC
jgi:hypothetical protein